MKIWKLKFEVDKFDNLMPVKGMMESGYRSFDGSSRKDTWQPLCMKRMEPEKNVELGDAPGFYMPIFSKKAIQVLEPIIQNSIEKLELRFDEGEYYAINVTTVLDVIDYPKSEYITFSDGKRIMVFEKYAFKICDDLINHNIFKIVDEPKRHAFVSEKFKRAVEENNLLGFKFNLVWDSEQETT